MMFSTLKSMALSASAWTHWLQQELLCLVHHIAAMQKVTFPFPPKKHKHPPAQCKTTHLEDTSLSPITEQFKTKCSLTHYDFFSIFNNPSTFATLVTSHTKLIHGTSEADIKLSSFSPLSTTTEPGLMFPKGGGFFTSMSLLNSWKSISEVGKHSLPPADTTCGRKQDGHCKEHSLILHKSI